MLIMTYTTTPSEAKDLSKTSLTINVETPSATRNDTNFSEVVSPISSIGHFKVPPKCDDPVFRAEAMSSEELSKLVFSPGYSVAAQIVTNRTTSTSSTGAVSRSSCSSISSYESRGIQEVRNCRDQDCMNINTKVLSRQISRQGRETQRWVTDENTHQMIRLVTGCVPILNNGKILFISASRKPEWILPKGGWEDDETMEESAIRETFEEAGVVGILGPSLAEVEYETRKSKKRKADLEDMMKKKEHLESFPSSPCDGESCEKWRNEHESVSNGPAVPSPQAFSFLERGAKHDSHVSFLESEPIIMSDDEVARIRESAAKKSDDASSVASTTDTSGYSHVRMTLFPLYVTEVKENWPESGRFRKAIDIDEAIKMLESRTEFHAFLLEVKKKGLHLVSQTP